MDHLENHDHNLCLLMFMFESSRETKWYLGQSQNNVIVTYKNSYFCMSHMLPGGCFNSSFWVPVFWSKCEIQMLELNPKWDIKGSFRR